MKRGFFSIAFAIAFVFLTAPVLAQNQWIQQSARPQPRNLSGVDWISTTHAFIAGEDMTLMETLDGGTTWRRIELNAGDSSYPLYDDYFTDANNGFAFGNSGSSGPDVYRTTDGGQNWQRVTNFPVGGSWYRMDFVSSNVGFIGANGAIARTTDGGATWQVMADYTTSPVVYGMDFRDAQVGVVGGNLVSTENGGPGIFKTTDGGATWQQMILPNQGFSPTISKIDFINENEGWAIGWYGYAARAFPSQRPTIPKRPRAKANPTIRFRGAVTRAFWKASIYSTSR